MKLRRRLAAGWIWGLFLLWPALSHGAARALLVGISDYQELPRFAWDGMADLRGGPNDVRIMQELLRDSFGITQVKTLIDAEATRDGILAAFEKWLIEGSVPGDLVVFFFSGHGSRIKDSHGDEADGYDEVLCPYDVVPQGGYNIIVDDELGSLLRRLQDRQVVAIIDACHSGSATRSLSGGGYVALETTPGATKYLSLSDFAGTRSAALTKELPLRPDMVEGQILFSASEDSQKAQELEMSPGAYFGVFTYYFVASLKAKTDQTYKQLYDQVRETLARRNLPQVPQIEPSENLAILERPVFAIAAGTNAAAAPPREPPAPSMRPQPLPVSPPAPPAPPAKTLLPASGAQRLRVCIEPFPGSTPGDMEEVSSRLGRLNYLQLVKETSAFDLLLRGEYVRGEYRARLINRLGDVRKLPANRTADDLVLALAPGLESAFLSLELATRRQDRPQPFKVRLRSFSWDGRRLGKEGADFRIGDRVVLRAEVEEPSYLYLLDIDGAGNVSLIYPNRYQAQTAPVKGEVLIPDSELRRHFEFQLLPPAGEETVKLIASRVPLPLLLSDAGRGRETFRTIRGAPMSESSAARELARDLEVVLRQGEASIGEDAIVLRSHAP